MELAAPDGSAIQEWLSYGRRLIIDRLALAKRYVAGVRHSLER